MFTKIVDSIFDDGSELTRYNLYRLFIYRFIIRELTKRSRQSITKSGLPEEMRDDRAQFMMHMAWWILNVKKENRFVADEIPVDIIPASLRKGRDTSTARREAILGSVIEPMGNTGVIGKKGQRFFYFPHKSYIEFLIAQYFAASRFTTDLYRIFLSNINPEILSFIEEGPEEGIKNLRQGLGHCVGQIDLSIVEACTVDHAITIELGRPKDFLIANHIYVHYLYVKKHDLNASNFLLTRITMVRTIPNSIALLNCIGNELSLGGDIDVAKMLLVNLLTSLSLHRIFQAGSHSASLKIYMPDLDGLKAALLLQCFWPSKNREVFTLNLNYFSAVIRTAARGSLYVELPLPHRKLSKIDINLSDIKHHLPSDMIRALENIFKSRSNVKPFFNIELIGEAYEKFDAL